MSIHVLIKRKWHINLPQDLFPLLNQLRHIASEQPGFLSSQTLRNSTKENEFLVISRWETMDDWDNWLASKERRNLQGRIDSLIGEKTFFEIYETLDDQGDVLSGKR